MKKNDNIRTTLVALFFAAAAFITPRIASSAPPAQESTAASSSPDGIEHKQVYKNLADFLKNGGHVLGYEIMPPAALNRQTQDEYFKTYNQFVNPTNKSDTSIPLDFALMMVGLSKLPPGAAFISHLSFDPKSEDKVLVTEDRKLGGDHADITLNRLQTWVHSKQIIHKHNTFYPASLDEVLAGPQTDMEYKLEFLKTPLDVYKSRTGECTTSSLERYALLQLLAAAGAINAGSDDIFILELLNKNGDATGGTIGHAVVGYFDKGRQAVILINGTGYQKTQTGELAIGDALLLEDTLKAQNKMRDLMGGHASFYDYFPIALHTRNYTYLYTPFDGTFNAGGRPNVKPPVYETGKDDPIIGYKPARQITEGPLTRGSYMKAYAH